MRLANFLIARTIEYDTEVAVADKSCDTKGIRNCIAHYDARPSDSEARSKYSGMDGSLIIRLRELEAENARLKKMYVEAASKIRHFTGGHVKKVVVVSRCKDLAKYYIDARNISIRLACLILYQHNLLLL